MENRDQIEVISKDSFDKNHGFYIKINKPVIIKDYIKHWPAIENWDLDYLRKKVGQVMVGVEHYPDNDYFGINFNTFLKKQKMFIKDYLELILQEKKKDSYYLADISIPQTFPELVEDLELPDFIDPLLYIKTVLFVGLNSITPMHYHPGGSQALLCQISGEKKFILYGPEQTPYLYQRRWYSPLGNFCNIIPENTNLEKFPNFIKAKGLEYTLKPGDAVFIPSYWWHAVYGLELSTSVTFFWKSNWSHRFSSGMQYLLLPELFYAISRKILSRSNNDYKDAIKTGLICT